MLPKNRGSISVGLARRARLAGKGVEQRRTLFHAGHHHTALGTHEHVTGNLIGTDTVGQARYVLGRKRQRESPTSFGFGSMGLIHHPIADRRRNPPSATRSQNSKLWLVTTISAASARRREPCTKHEVPK